MWAIQLDDGNRKMLFLRNMLLDGDILVFDKEETALRFMQLLSADISKALGIKLRTVRFENKIKNEKPAKVSNASFTALAEILRTYLRQHCTIE